MRSGLGLLLVVVGLLMEGGCVVVELTPQEEAEQDRRSDHFGRKDIGKCETSNTTRFHVMFVIDEKEFEKSRGKTENGEFENLMEDLEKTFVEGLHRRMGAIAQVSAITFGKGVTQLDWTEVEGDGNQSLVLALKEKAPDKSEAAGNHTCFCGALKAMTELVKQKEEELSRSSEERVVILLVSSSYQCGRIDKCFSKGSSPLEEQVWQNTKEQVKKIVMMRGPNSKELQLVNAQFWVNGLTTWAISIHSWPYMELFLTEKLFRDSKGGMTEPDDDKCWKNIPVCLFRKDPGGCLMNHENVTCATNYNRYHVRPGLSKDVCEATKIDNCSNTAGLWQCGLPLKEIDVNGTLSEDGISGTVSIWIWLIPLIISVLIAVCCLILLLLWFLRRRRMAEAARRRPPGTPAPVLTTKEWLLSFIPMEMTQKSGRSVEVSVNPGAADFGADPMTEGGQEVSAAVPGKDFAQDPMTTDSRTALETKTLDVRGKSSPRGRTVRGKSVVAPSDPQVDASGWAGPAMAAPDEPQEVANSETALEKSETEAADTRGKSTHTAFTEKSRPNANFEEF